MFLVYVVLCFLVLVVSASAIDCLERLVSEMTRYVTSWTLDLTHRLTHHHSTMHARKISRQKEEMSFED